MSARTSDSRASGLTQESKGARVTAWLRAHLSYADVSESTLRATLAALRLSGLFRQQRAAIEHELAMRAWAEQVEQHLERSVCAWCDRGGVS